MELTGAPSLPQKASSVTWRGQWMGVLGFACLLAFSWIPNSYYLMVGWPWILIWQIAFLMLGAWQIWIVRQFAVPFRPLGHGFDWAVGGALSVNIVSALGAEFKAVALWNVVLVGNYAIALYLLVNWLRQGLSRKYLWFALVLAGWITSVVGLSLWRPTPEMWLSDNFYTALRNAWPLGHHNFVGGYELLLLPMTAGFALSQQGWKRWVGMGAATTVAVALYVSGSRGAMVGAVAVVAVGTPILLWLHRAQASRRWLVGCAVGLAIVLSIIASNPRMRSLFQVAAPSQVGHASVVVDGPAQDRLFMLQAARNIFSTHPLTGVGPGNLSRVYNLYRPIEVGTGLELVQQLHNTPAQMLAELGALGLAVYGGWLIGLLRLSVRLHSKLSNLSDRYLFYGICASYLGYGVSSLTDYQLENIGISSTLLIMTALLINLGDACTDSSRSAELSRQSRRWLSLGILAFLCLSFQLWTRFDAGLYLSNAAIRDIGDRNLVDADAKWFKAGTLVAWDPTYPALAAEQLILLRAGAANQADEASLTKSAIEYLDSALKAVPNDTWLNQNMAVLQLESNQPKKAESYIRRTALLSPRNANYTYYTLGLSYLQQNQVEQVEQAIAAFSLEGIANPSFLTADIWTDENFALMLPVVLDKVLESDRRILSQTNPVSLDYEWINEQIALLSWWYKRPLEGVDIAKLRPLVQAILKLEDQPEVALSMIDQQLALDADNASLRLLQAWRSPEKYLKSYLKDFEGTQEEKDLLIKHINQNRDIRAWMGSVLNQAPQSLRNGVGFAYRNLAANNVVQILYPGDLRMSFFSELLGLFEEAPRIFPQLDQEISAVKTAELSLLPLSETHFQMPKS